MVTSLQLTWPLLPSHAVSKDYRVLQLQLWVTQHTCVEGHVILDLA